jgi:hypothetical protein
MRCFDNGWSTDSAGVLQAPVADFVSPHPPRSPLQTLIPQGLDVDLLSLAPACAACPGLLRKRTHAAQGWAKLWAKFRPLLLGRLLLTAIIPWRGVGLSGREQPSGGEPGAAGALAG